MHSADRLYNRCICFKQNDDEAGYKNRVGRIKYRDRPERLQKDDKAAVYVSAAVLSNPALDNVGSEDRQTIHPIVKRCSGNDCLSVKFGHSFRRQLIKLVETCGSTYCSLLASSYW